MQLHDDDPEFREYIRKIVDAAPPPTPEQRARIPEILRDAAHARQLDKINKAGGADHDVAA
jgi:hypothetical protein